MTGGPLTGIAITFEPVGDALMEARAWELARQLDLPMLTPGTPGLLLTVTPRRLQLRSGDGREEIHAEFLGGRTGWRLRSAQSSRQTLGRAVGLRRGSTAPHVLDATAGLAADAVLLAILGCRVTAVERSPVVAALVGDGLERARVEPRLAAVLAKNFRLIVGDSREVLARLTEPDRPDVVYLDPMFAAGRGSAAARKEMRLIRLAAGNDPDAADLLTAALPVARQRVVVKRPLRSEPLGKRPPDFVYTGRVVRFDVYRPAAL